jgi:hypothetical protein
MEDKITVIENSADRSRHVRHDRLDSNKVLKSGGFRVRSDLRAGDWRCRACSGETMGSSLFKPQCEYCEKI